MRMVFGLVLIVGVGLAGAAVFMVKNYVAGKQLELNQERAARGEIGPTIRVFVANRQLKYGEQLHPQDVRQVLMPINGTPPGGFVDPEALFPFGEKKLRVVLRTVELNEAILDSKVTEPGVGAGIVSQLEKGMRAFAIKVDVASGVSGFLRPGDRVDVYWTGRVAGAGLEGNRGEVTKLIETGVKLIAIDQIADEESTETVIARTVTVAARPQQVAALAQAQTTGRLSLSLVGAEDDTVAEAIEVDQRSLLGIETAPVAAPVQEEKVCTIRTRRGAEVVELPIPCAN